MKILLDENIDVRFKKLFPADHEVYTVNDMHWNGIKNGTLLKLLKEHQFDCWVVVDKNLPYQQNVSILPCTVIVLDVYRNTLKHITPLMPSITATLANDPGNIVVILAE